METPAKSDLTQKIELLLNSKKTDLWTLCVQYQLSPAKLEIYLEGYGPLEFPNKFIDNALAFLFRYGLAVEDYLDFQYMRDPTLNLQDQFNFWWNHPAQPRKFFRGMYN
jgi:hypothetical protein